MTSGADRLVRQQLDRRVADLPDWPTAVVTAVTAGGGTDGQDLVTVNYLGSIQKLPHLDTYTPVIGHVVALARVNGLPTVIGRPIGFPPDTA